jgi:DNA-directed RNA polymerase subunit RPC12/RpoP
MQELIEHAIQDIQSGRDPIYVTDSLLSEVKKWQLSAIKGHRKPTAKGTRVEPDETKYKRRDKWGKSKKIAVDDASHGGGRFLQEDVGEDREYECLNCGNEGTIADKHFERTGIHIKCRRCGSWHVQWKHDTD